MQRPTSVNTLHAIVYTTQIHCAPGVRKVASRTTSESNCNVVCGAPHAPLLARCAHTQSQPDLVYPCTMNVCLPASYCVQMRLVQPEQRTRTGRRPGVSRTCVLRVVRAHGHFRRETVLAPSHSNQPPLFRKGRTSSDRFDVKLPQLRPFSCDGGALNTAQTFLCDTFRTGANWSIDWAW